MTKHNLKVLIMAAAASLVILALLFGCAAPKQTESDKFLERWKKLAEESRGISPSARKRTLDLKEDKSERTKRLRDALIQDKPLPTKKVTVQLRDVEVSVVLRALARAVGQSILINDRVTGKISVEVIDQPWHQVFQGILNAQGLSYTWEGEIVRIMTKEDMEVERPLTRLIKIDYTSAKDLKTNLEKILTHKDKDSVLGSIMVDEHTNSIIIQAIRADMKRILPLIVMLDRPTAQVLIKAHIIEANKDTARELGVQWGGLHRSGSVWLYPGTKSGTALGGDISTAPNPGSGLATNFPTALPLTLAGAGLNLGLLVSNLGESLLALQLSALQRDGKLNILSSPSITTLDNMPAFIESGKEVPFRTTDDTGKSVIEWKKATLKLQVTPHVIDGRMLKLEISTKKDELDFTQTVMGNPTIITKNAQTTVILMDGQTTVIGGLSKEKTSRSESGIPGLKDIPFLGFLFKGQGKTTNLEEVLIFITPYILKRLPVDGAKSRRQEDGALPEKK